MTTRQAFVLCIFLGACSKSSSDGAGPAPSSSAAPVASTPTADAAPATVKWTGKYTASAGYLFVPDGGEWAGTKWHGDDAGDGLGDGTVSLQVSGAHVDGTIDGVLGPAVVDGSVFGDKLTGNIVRKDPTDRGFVGTLECTVKDKAASCEMHLSSLVNANLLRQAKLDLAKEG